MISTQDVVCGAVQPVSQAEEDNTLTFQPQEKQQAPTRLSMVKASKDFMSRSAGMPQELHAKISQPMT